MKRAPLTLLAILVLVAPVLGTAVSPAAAMPDGRSRYSFWIRPSSSAGDAWDVFVPSKAGDYRTSPSIFKDPTTERFMQFSCGLDPSSPVQTIRFSTSSDGQTWSSETVALRPTWSSLDAGGVCDPSVVRSGPYFYMAYTGFDRTKHAVFVARTTSLTQPWQKWNGQGWGGPRPPAPIVVAPTGTPGFGVGQPSLVVMSGSLSVFHELHNGTTWQTRLASAPLRTDNVDTWPTQVTAATTVLTHPGDDSKNVCNGSYDSTDVAYGDMQGKYVAVTTDAKTFARSSLKAYESPTGFRFTKALTRVTQTGTSPIEDHAHHVSWVRDPAGHLRSWGPPIVYGYGDSDCPSKLRWQDTDTGEAQTGWVDEPLTKAAGTTHWNLATTGWTFDSNGWLHAGHKALDPPTQAFLKTSVVSGNATIDLDYKQNIWPDGIWTGISFGHLFPDLDWPGYFLRMHTTGEVTLARGSEDNVVATGATSASAQFFPNHLQVVLSDNTITVYNGVGHDSLTNVILRYTSPDDLQLTGYIGLQSRGISAFTNLTVRDDVPASYLSQDENVLDWKQSTGDWKVRAPSTISSYDASTGQIFLQGKAGPVSNYNAHLGDGTYTATVQLNPGAPASSWGGLNVANGAQQASLDFATGGYLVFVRANGNLGLWKGGGPGQVVPDVPTGLNPIPTPVKIRVVKVGANIQVYLNSNALPTISYTDPGTPFVTGGFGLATYATAGLFTSVAYAANNGV